MDIYISSSVKKDIKEALELAKDLNTNIEISRFGDVKTIDKDFDEKLSLITKELKGFNGKISLHGFFIDLYPFSADPKIREISRYRYEQSFKVAKAINASTIVFHASYNELIKHPLYDAEFFGGTIEFWQKFIKGFEQEGITAVLENTFENTPAPILKIVDEVGSKNLKMCIDTGHININSSLPVPEWIKLVGDKLHHMHLHNNMGNMDAHNSILQGEVNFESVFEMLFAQNSKSNLVFEIFNEQQVRESVEFYRKQLAKIHA